MIYLFMESVLFKSADKSYRLMFILFCFLLICRLISMIFIPLNDTTEARYGEIARIMLETGNWVTPMQAYGEPFWAKPPLSMWMQAFSMKCFGVNAFAARLPALLLSLGVLGLVWLLADKQKGRFFAICSAVVLAGSPFFFLSAGTVMTDPYLLFCLTLCMVSFWLSVAKSERLWGYLFFVGLGLGLLAKGPLIGVLVGFPILIWTIKQNAWRAIWTNLPWCSGVLLMLCIAMPWYIWAELKTPGFLNYFIVGEHISRFLEPGWQGDKYGFAHKAPLGMIWIYALIGVIPWVIYGVIGLIKSRKSIQLNFKWLNDDGWLSYLLFFMLTPLLFFTMARNIIYPYCFPFLPAFALLFSELLVSVLAKKSNLMYPVAAIVGVIFLVGTGLFVIKPVWVEKSQYRVISSWREHSVMSDPLIYWADKTEYSARFYSHGQVKSTHDPLQLSAWLAVRHPQYLVVNARDLNQIPTEIQHRLHRIEQIQILKQSMVLFKTK